MDISFFNLISWHACADHYSAENLRGSSTDPGMSRSMQLFPLWYSVLCTLATLFSPNSQVCVINSVKLVDSIHVSSPCIWPGNSLKEVNGGDFSTHLFISPILGITFLHFFWGPVSCKPLLSFTVCLYWPFKLGG